MPKLVSLPDAESSLAELVRQVEQGRVDEIVIARDGRPAARLVPATPPSAARERRIGVAKGRFVAPADLDARNDEVRRLLEGA